MKPRREKRYSNHGLAKSNPSWQKAQPAGQHIGDNNSNNDNTEDDNDGDNNEDDKDGKHCAYLRHPRMSLFWERRAYHYLNAFGLTPWIALHLFYVMILTLFSWMNQNGHAEHARTVCEGLYTELSWVVPVCEAMMLPVFLYWFYLQLAGKTVFPKKMAFTSVLIIYAALKGLTLLMPVSAFRIGFTNGLMSESMLLWFLSMMLWEKRHG